MGRAKTVTVDIRTIGNLNSVQIVGEKQGNEHSKFRLRGPGWLGYKQVATHIGSRESKISQGHGKEEEELTETPKEEEELYTVAN